MHEFLTMLCVNMVFVLLTKRKKSIKHKAIDVFCLMLNVRSVFCMYRVYIDGKWRQGQRKCVVFRVFAFQYTLSIIWHATHWTLHWAISSHFLCFHFLFLSLSFSVCPIHIYKIIKMFELNESNYIFTAHTHSN